METISSTEMLHVLGGYNSVLCTALQNYINMYGKRMTEQQWREWSEAWEANCKE